MTRQDRERPLVVELGGEEPVVAWPLLLRERIGRRVRDSDRYRWWVLWSALAGLFAFGFTITIVAVSLGTIADDLGASETTLTWVVTGPFLALALSMPLFGRVGDLWGHRRVYLIGFLAYTVGTVLTALAWNAPALIALRVLAAIPGAATGPTSMALIMRAFPQRDRVKAMGWWALVAAGAPVLGLVAGGPAVDAFGWRAIFVGQAPLCVVALGLGIVVLRETPRAPREPIDLAGALTLAMATVAPLLALTLGAEVGWRSPVVVTLFVATPFLAWLFVRIERRAAHPLLPLSFFGRPNFTPSLVAQYASNFAYMGGFIVTPLLVQSAFSFSVAQTSLAMTARPLTFSLSAPICGYLAVRVGERRVSIIGCACVVVSMALFALGASAGILALIFVALAVSGLGLGASQPSLTTVVANTVEPEHLGVANGAQQMVAQIGVVSGIQALSVLQGAAGGTTGFVAAYLAGGAVAVVGLLGAWRVRSVGTPGTLEAAA